jgi:hypothetical protein
VDSVIKNSTIQEVGNKKFITMGNKFVDIQDLNIDLIDQINPFQKAFEILSKNVTVPVLRLIQEAIDAMKKADTVWEPLDSDVFPMPMRTAVEYACQIMGVTLDERSVISGYSVDYPANDQTWRQTLQYIAAASLGNFIITEANQLRLVPLISAAPAALLVNENGDAITFGEVGILV